MAVIKLVEDYAVSQLRKDVRDSLMMAGEEAILLQLFHPGDRDAVPCIQCGDDVYKSPEADCTSCYGTRYQGGVREARKIWTLFADHTPSEQLARTGTYQPDSREIQFEHSPLVTEHDMVVRVRNWGADSTPTELEGYYELTQVNRRSLRTGARFGQTRVDVVAQKSTVNKLPANAPIGRYPVLGVSFAVPLAVEQVTTPRSVAVQPDSRVIFFASGGTEVHKYSVTIGNGVDSTITIYHNLGTRDVVVSLHDATTMAEVDTDVTHTTSDSITLGFATPPAPNSLRVTVTG